VKERRETPSGSNPILGELSGLRALHRRGSTLPLGETVCESNDQECSRRGAESAEVDQSGRDPASVACLPVLRDLGALCASHSNRCETHSGVVLQVERRCSGTRRQGCPNWNLNAPGVVTAAALFGLGVV